MPYYSDTPNITALAGAAEPDLGEDWLEIEGEPGRQAVLEWSGNHALAVVVAGCIAVSVPLIAALCFG